MMKRLVVLFLVMVVAASVFAAGGKEATQEGPRSLLIAAPPWIKTKTATLAAVESFQKTHPNVTIEVVTVDKWGGPTYIPEWQAGKTSFDLFISGTGTMLAELIVGGWLDPLDDMLTGAMAKEKFVAGFLKEGAYRKADGGTYYPVIPFLGEEASLGINTEVLKSAGLWKDGKPVGIPSWKEADFFGWFRKLAPFSDQGAHVQIWDKEFIQYNYAAPLLAMTGSFLDSSGKGFDVSSEAARTWMHMVQKLHTDKLANYTVTDTAGYEAWKTGKAGSFFAAQGHTMELVLSAGKPVDAIGYVSWPGAETHGSIIWTHSVWIPKVSRNKDLARAFIQEMVFSKDFQQWQFNNWGKLPVLKEAYGEGIERYAEYMPMILEIADNSQSIPLFKDLQAYADILKKYLPEAAQNRMSVEEALSKIAAESAGLDFTDIRAN
jgi:ABC-type glycerol-3-phosphate transport system substrate-binding protein